MEDGPLEAPIIVRQKIPSNKCWGFSVCSAKENRFFALTRSWGATHRMLALARILLAPVRFSLISRQI